MNKHGVSLLAALALLGACGKTDSRQGTIQQTGFPGQLTAGGTTSGDVMSRSTQATASSMPAGTPGIPLGSGGNVGGTALGGTISKEGGNASGTAAGSGQTPAAPASSGGAQGGNTRQESAGQSGKEGAK